MVSCVVVCALVPGISASAYGAEVAVRLSRPPDGALVRADVPIFGVATCPEFKEWRLEVAKKFGPGGEALEPEWRLLARGTQAIQFDPWSAGQVKWDPNRGAPGNIYTWGTGAPSYPYMPYPRTEERGVYRLKLSVEDAGGAGLVA